MDDFFKSLGFTDETNQRYVYFNQDTGSIESVSNEKDDSRNYIIVDAKEVQRIIDGIDTMLMYKVQLNTKTKKLELVSDTSYKVDLVGVNEYIYEIPKPNGNEPADVSIIESQRDTCWKFYLSKDFKQTIRNTGGNLSFPVSFSITKKGDPNVLYKHITFNFANLVNDTFYIVPFSQEFETNMEPVSVYTAKIFNSYEFITEHE